MDSDDIFSAADETIELHGLDSILKFTRFHPLNKATFMEGLELADDLKSDSGTILYPNGTEVNYERIERLLKFRESNPDMNFNFKIKRSERLIRKFRQEIKERMEYLLSRRKKSKLTRDLMRNLDNYFNTVVDKVLGEQNTTLALYKMRFACELAKTQQATRYSDYAMEVAIFSLALATSEKYEPAVRRPARCPVCSGQDECRGHGKTPYSAPGRAYSRRIPALQAAEPEIVGIL